MTRYYFYSVTSTVLVVETPDGWYVRHTISPYTTHQINVSDPAHTIDPSDFADAGQVLTDPVTGLPIIDPDTDQGISGGTP